MKKIFIVCYFFIPMHAISQQPQINRYQNKIYNELLKKLNSPTPQDSSTNKLQSLPGMQARLLHVLPNGNKVYQLPLDNMPCVVPDKIYNNYNMPVYRGKQEGFIPNLSPVLPLIPGELYQNKKPLN